MKKFVCQICGYVHEGDSAPEFCPQCKAPASKFTEVVENEKVWAAEHVGKRRLTKRRNTPRSLRNCWVKS